MTRLALFIRLLFLPHYASNCLIDTELRGGLVYDPFMGTGTLAIAALEQKMAFVGSEISEEYVNYAERRIKNHSKQLSLW